MKTVTVQIMPGFEQCCICRDESRGCTMVDGDFICPACLESQTSNDRN